VTWERVTQLPQLDFVKPSNQFHPVTWEHVTWYQQVVKLTSWVGMAPNKNGKQPQDSVLEELVDDQVAPPESIGEEEPMPREDRNEPESEEEEQRSSVLFTPE
jgi:hypothetical protein